MKVDASLLITIATLAIGPGGLVAVALVMSNRRKINAEANKMEVDASITKKGSPVDLATLAVDMAEKERARADRLWEELDNERHDHSKTRKQRNSMYNLVDAVIRYMNRRDAECEVAGHEITPRPAPLLQYMREGEQLADDNSTTQ